MPWSFRFSGIIGQFAQMTSLLGCTWITTVYTVYSLGFQTPCEEVFEPQKPSQKTKPQQVFGRLGIVLRENPWQTPRCLPVAQSFLERRRCLSCQRRNLVSNQSSECTRYLQGNWDWIEQWKIPECPNLSPNMIWLIYPEICNFLDVFSWYFFKLSTMVNHH